MVENKPKIRFKKYSKEWESKKIRSFADVAMCRRIYKNQTSEKGEIPFFKIGTFGEMPDAYIKRELYEEYKKKYDFPQKGNILFSASGTIGRIVEYKGEDEYFQDSNIVWLNHSEEIIDIFIKYALEQITWDGLEGSTIKRLYNRNILESLICKPDINEQKDIGAFLENISQIIKEEKNKLLIFNDLKRTMLKKMFPQGASRTPEIRFKGFEGEWEEKKLDGLCSVITKQTGFDYSATIKPSLLTEKTTETYSFIQNKDFEGLYINFDTDFYIPKIVAEKFDKIILDQPSLLISISGRIGNVGFYNYSKKAFIGGAVGICKLLNPSNGNLLLFELLSPYGQNYFQGLIKASSHQNITVEDIRSIHVFLPKRDEEKEEISKFLLKLYCLIEKQKEKINNLENIKTTLLSKMFV